MVVGKNIKKKEKEMQNFDLNDLLAVKSIEILHRRRCNIFLDEKTQLYVLRLGDDEGAVLDFYAKDVFQALAILNVLENILIKTRRDVPVVIHFSYAKKLSGIQEENALNQTYRFQKFGSNYIIINGKEYVGAELS